MVKSGVYLQKLSQD